MRVSDAQLAEVFDRGWTVVEGFLSADMLAAAREALWEIYPRPEDYFAAPEKHPNFGKSQFSGIRLFPYDQWALNAITVDPDLIDAAERFHRSRTSRSTRWSCGASMPGPSTTTSPTTATTATTPWSPRARTTSTPR